MSGPARAGRIALLSLEWLAVIVFGLLLLGLVALFALLWWPYEPPAKVGVGAAATAGTRAGASVPPPLASAPPSNDGPLFAPIFQVLQSPRCMNCHPAGDRPLWRDGQEHPMNLSRASFASGLACQTCHQQRNADELGVRGGPPGAPHWQLPPKDMPMVFQGRSLAALCRQLRDPAHNGGKTLPALLHHVREDPLVLWAWKPGANRSPPPLGHAAFVSAFEAWVEAEGRCPGDDAETTAP